MYCIPITTNDEQKPPNNRIRPTTFGAGTQTFRSGKKFMAMDSAMPPPFTFTPSISLFVECETEEEIAKLYSVLSNGGEVLMPLDNYGFSQRFGWVNDRFGVSWQLNQTA